MAAYNSCGEDSDATVAPEEQEFSQVEVMETEGEDYTNSQVMDTNSDCSPQASPSLLHPSTASQLQNISRDIVPCSSDETNDEMLSQEYPPPAPQRRVATTTLNSPQEAIPAKGHINQSQETLSRVEREQGSLMSRLTTVLGNYGEILPPNFVKSTREAVSGLEERLMTLSQAHQAERREIVAVHSQLSQSQESLSQDISEATGGQSLRTQLLSLSARQKKLLECFKKQKEISLKVCELVERDTKGKRTVESSVKNATSEKATSIVLPNLAKHLTSHPKSTKTNSSNTHTITTSSTSIGARVSSTSNLPAQAVSTVSNQVVATSRISTNACTSARATSMPAHSSRAVISQVAPASHKSAQVIPIVSKPNPAARAGLPQPRGSSNPSQLPLPTPASDTDRVLATPASDSVSIAAVPRGGANSSHLVPTTTSASNSASTITNISAGNFASTIMNISANYPAPQRVGGVNSSHPPLTTTSASISNSTTTTSAGSSAATVKALGSELTQPVPLSTLTHHGILTPGSILNCTILGCEFRVTLLKDGGLREIHTQGSPGFLGQSCLHQQPQQWLRSCWSRLGHCHKKIVKKQAYNAIFFSGKPLSHYCEKYSRQQVSRYLSHKKSSGTKPPQGMNNITKPKNAESAVVNTNLEGEAMDILPASQPGISIDQSDASKQPGADHHQVVFDPVMLLANCQVLLVTDDYHSHTLPAQYWEEGSGALSSAVLQQIEMDLNF